MTKSFENANPVKELDDDALDDIAAAGKVYTGGRFQLDIGAYQVGYLKNGFEAPPPPPPPPPKP